MEDEILKFRNQAIPFFRAVLLKEGYDNSRADELAFYTVKVLEDSFPLVQNFEKRDTNTENILDNIHMLFTNRNAFEEGKKILMWKD